MKLDLLTVGALFAGLLAASCSKPDTASDDATSAEESESIASGTPPAPTVAAPPSPVAIAPAPAPKRLAPDGIFFLLTKKSVETDSGIVGLRPGAQVTRQPDGKFSIEGQTLELAPGEITNDLDVAARVAGADARAQAAIRQTLAARPAAAVTAPEAADETGPSANSASESLPPASTSMQRSGSSLGGTNSLGSVHTRTQNGWLYQKNSAGEWEPVRRTR